MKRDAKGRRVIQISRGSTTLTEEGRFDIHLPANNLSPSVSSLAGGNPGSSGRIHPSYDNEGKPKDEY